MNSDQQQQQNKPNQLLDRDGNFRKIELEDYLDLLERVEKLEKIVAKIT